jgi:hypothetical protein
MEKKFFTNNNFDKGYKLSKLDTKINIQRLGALLLHLPQFAPFPIPPPRRSRRAPLGEARWASARRDPLSPRCMAAWCRTRVTAKT